MHDERPCGAYETQRKTTVCTYGGTVKRVRKSEWRRCMRGDYMMRSVGMPRRTHDTYMTQAANGFAQRVKYSKTTVLYVP